MSEHTEKDALPMRVFLSPLTGRAYATNDYDEAGPLRGFVANSSGVTNDVVHDLMAIAGARGWNECNAAPEGASSPNPSPHLPSNGGVA